MPPGVGGSRGGWRCYAITTSDRPERSARVRRELERIGLPYRISTYERPDDDGGFVSPGTHGCFLSHLATLQLARDDGADVAVIVEDDVVIARRFRRLLPSLVDQLEGLDWPMLYLGYGRSSPIRRHRLRRVAEHIAACDDGRVIGSHFVAIPRREFDGLITSFERRLAPGGHRIAADAVLDAYRGDTGRATLVCLPNLAQQGPSPSGITDRPGLRARLLHYRWISALVWPYKRLRWDLEACIPPGWWERSWNRRADRAS